VDAVDAINGQSCAGLLKTGDFQQSFCIQILFHARLSQGGGDSRTPGQRLVVTRNWEARNDEGHLCSFPPKAVESLRLRRVLLMEKHEVFAAHELCVGGPVILFGIFAIRIAMKNLRVFEMLPFATIVSFQAIDR
jgi:hypothetical protein